MNDESPSGPSPLRPQLVGANQPIVGLEQQLAEQSIDALRESEVRFYTIFDNNPAVEPKSGAAHQTWHADG